MRSASSGSPIAAAIAQAAEAAEEATVGLVGPTDVAGAAPAVGTQGVETAVVADAIGGVALDRVAARGRRAPPTRRATRVGHDDLGHARPTVVGRCRERLAKGVVSGSGLGGQHRAGRTGRMHRDRVLTHGITLRPMVRTCSPDLETAKNIGIAIVVGLVVLMVVVAS